MWYLLGADNMYSPSVSVLSYIYRPVSASFFQLEMFDRVRVSPRFGSSGINNSLTNKSVLSKHVCVSAWVMYEWCVLCDEQNVLLGYDLLCVNKYIGARIPYWQFQSSLHGKYHPHNINKYCYDILLTIVLIIISLCNPLTSTTDSFLRCES